MKVLTIAFYYLSKVNSLVKATRHPIYHLLCISIFMLGIILPLQAHDRGDKLESAAWQKYGMSFKSSTITVIHPASMAGDRGRLEWLITMADRSTVSLDPMGNNSSGLIRVHDVLVITNDLLLWFNCESASSVSTNGGGGLLRGLWSLHLDGSNSLNFKRITNANNYAASYLYAGSVPGVQGSGISLLGNFGVENIDNGVTFAIEHEHQPIITELTGTTVAGNEYAGGVFAQFTGYLGNSSIGISGLAKLGLQDHYDCDARSDAIGRCQYILTYKIPVSGEAFRQEINLYVTQNNFGPCATMVLSHNIAGYPENTVSIVSDRPLQTNGLVRDPYPYFTHPEKELEFYKMPWVSHAGTNRWWEPPVGEGTLSGAGLPWDAQPVPYIFYQPSIVSLPAALQESYALQTIDNQGANSSNRCLALDLQLWDVNRGTAPQIFPQGSTMNIITEYSVRLPESSGISSDIWRGL